MDARDLAAFETLWAPDAVLEVFQDGPAAAPTGRMRAGRHFHHAFERLGAYVATIHHVTTHAVDVAGDEASGSTCCVAHHFGPPGDDGGTDLVMQIRYEDRFVRTEEGWRFAYRRVHVLATESRTPDVLA